MTDINLDDEALFIRIMTPLFYKKIGAAYGDFGDVTKVINNHQLSIYGLKNIESLTSQIKMMTG
ncbi:hypothetical protein D3C84_894600 [compost metagenome]